MEGKNILKKVSLLEEKKKEEKKYNNKNKIKKLKDLLDASINMEHSD